MPRRSTSVALGSVLAIAVAGAGASLAFVNAKPADKIGICHAASSTSNPYVKATVDVNSTDLSGHESHTGPLFEEGMTSGWGDIIPPIADILPEGRNWPAGQAILENGCKLVQPSPTPTPTETSSPTPTPTETSSPTPTPTETSSPTPTPTETTSPSPTPTGTSTPAPTTPSTSAPVPAPVTTVTPASPETPVPIDADEVAPVEIADPGALPEEDEPSVVQPASPQQSSVPTSVPAGGGAARNDG